MNRRLLFLLAAFALASCARPIQRATVVIPVPIEESVVRTEADAIRIALAFVDTSGEAQELRLDSAKANEQPDRWMVWIDKIKVVRPSAALISIDKRTGIATRIPLR